MRKLRNVIDHNAIMARLMVGSVLIGAAYLPVSAQDWKPASNALFTRYGKGVDPEHVLPEYPRPQMARKQWLNLNGLWLLSLQSKNPGQYEYDQHILVPFPVESALSGVKGRVEPSTLIRYRRSFDIPADWAGKHVLLHFGAVDWEATVRVNGKTLGTHRGGYDPFSFDITSALTSSGTQQLEVEVVDPTDSSTIPRGKQVLNPEGIFYTCSSGIWQTVWLEPVPESHIDSLLISTSISPAEAHIGVSGPIGADYEIRASAADGENVVAEAMAAGGKDLILRIPHAKLWSPRSAFLYRLRVQVLDRGSKTPVDEVQSYFGLRTITVQKENGIPKLFLNGKPEFMFGTLDQGFWPDGLYTPPSDQAIQSDLFGLKSLGFNTIRKHVKVEPERWYYWCDKLGILVWQDMPSGDKSIGPNDPDITRSADSASEFETELKSMIRSKLDHPSIVMWVPFNEGWGQYDTERITKWIKQFDPTRLVDSASGWADRETGDVADIHSYPGPAAPGPQTSRAIVLGEFGGLGLPEPGHLWSEKGWSYKGFQNSDELSDAFVSLMTRLRGLQQKGLSAAIYTQTTDCETELNGLWTYDREVMKLDASKVRPAIMNLYAPLPKSAATPVKKTPKPKKGK